MAKRLIICCNGSWDGSWENTNIAWLSEFVARDHEQFVYYGLSVDPGRRELTGGALGGGLADDVCDAYRFVQKNYTAGDEIYCFGCSRGAFIARALCGFMEFVGQMKAEQEITDAYHSYILGKSHNDPRDPIPIRLLGVFETVGVSGIPAEPGDGTTESRETNPPLAQLGWRGFRDTRLGSTVEHAYHGLAIDEPRALLLPCLWTSARGLANQTVEQVWFAGAHCDVAGGYGDEPRLADIPLLWMIEKAVALGLRLKEGAAENLRRRTDPLAPHHDPMGATWGTHSKLKRTIRPMTNAERRAIDPGGDKFPEVRTPEGVHSSVAERLGQEVTICSEAGSVRALYTPPNLPQVVEKPERAKE